MANTNKVTDEQIIQALRANHGFKSQACKSLEKQLNITFSASAMSQRIAKSQKIQDALNEMMVADLDFVENKLWTLINGGNTAAVLFYLKTKGKDRGYAERREITGANGTPIQMTDPLAGLTKEEMMKIVGLTATNTNKSKNKAGS